MYPLSELCASINLVSLSANPDVEWVNERTGQRPYRPTLELHAAVGALWQTISVRIDSRGRVAIRGRCHDGLRILFLITTSSRAPEHSSEGSYVVMINRNHYQIIETHYGSPVGCLPPLQESEVVNLRLIRDSYGIEVTTYLALCGLASSL